MLIDEPQVLEVTEAFRALLRETMSEYAELPASELRGIELRSGVYETIHFGAHVDGYDQFPEFGAPMSERWRQGYGVCDNLDQILAHYPELEAPGREFFVTLTEVRRDEQTPTGGWRWHKWGRYIGTFERQYEYLYDEVGIERVFCFQIYERKTHA